MSDPSPPYWLAPAGPAAAEIAALTWVVLIAGALIYRDGQGQTVAVTLGLVAGAPGTLGLAAASASSPSS
jgi:hypothetical protein